MNTKIKEQVIFQIVEGTLTNVINGFLIDRKTRGLSPQTIHFYTVELRYFSQYMDLLGVIKFSEITPDVIRQYLLSLGSHRNKGGIHGSYRAIKVMFNFYESEFEPDNWKNPIKKVKVSRPTTQPLPGIPIDDIRKLIDQCKGNNYFDIRDRAIFYFLLDTGLRAMELISLSIRDIDLMTGSVTVKHGKGDKRRVVFLARSGRKELRRYLKIRIDLKDDYPLFSMLDNSSLTFWGLRDMVCRRSIKAGITPPGLHDFRRAFALAMLRQGADLITVSRLLGHSSLAVTQRYIALNDSDLLEVHNRTSPGNLLK